MTKNISRFIGMKNLTYTLAVLGLGLYPFNANAVAYYPAGTQPTIQVNPFLQSIGYFGTPYYPAAGGYYGGYSGAYNYYPSAYPQTNSYTPYYSPYLYSNSYYSPYPHRHHHGPRSYRPATTMVPTEITRHPPKMANPWFTSPDYRSRHGISGR